MFYLSSNEAKEGYQEHINDKTGAVSYWKTFYGVEGYLDKLYIKESEFNGIKLKYLNIGLSDDEGTVFIQLPLSTSKGGLNSYVKSFVRYFPNIDLGKKLIFIPARAKPGEAFAPGNFFISYVEEDGNKTLIPQYYKKDTNGWPAPQEETDIYGAKRLSYKGQDNFAYQTLLRAIEKIDERKGNARRNVAPQQSNKPTTVTGNVDANNAKVSAPRPSKVTQEPPAYPPQPGNFGVEDDLPF